jgi:hypothetical protein
VRVSLSLVAARWSFVSNTRDVRNNEESKQITPESKVRGLVILLLLVFVLDVTDTAGGYREDSEEIRKCTQDKALVASFRNRTNQ